MAYTINHYITDWVEESRALMQPDKVLWIDGTETQLEELRREAYITGELIKLNQEKLPGCVYHRSALNDVARVEGRTFICCKKEEDAGPTNNWMAPDEMKAKLHDIYAGCMRGRTMYVIPYSMGAIGSPFAKYGIEITDSIYVVCCMAIMTRVGTKVYEALGDSPDFVKGLHSKAELDADKRYIAHFPEENLIMSVNSGYGGNALLGKKCFALRIASTLGREEGWLAEHMLILGVQNPKGEIRYVCGAFPSACGTTNLAMLIPPAAWREKGWKCWCVGDDIAWLRPGPDGRLWAVNPENGFFGVAPGTSEKTNPNALAATRKNTIFTNVVLKPDGTAMMVSGSPGGAQIIAAMVNMVSNIVDHNMNLADAVYAPRFYANDTGKTYLEGRFPQETIDALTALGHDVQVQAEYNPNMGSANTIVVLEDGSYHAVGDPRRDSQAAAY